MEQLKRYNDYPREETNTVVYETAREVAVKILNRIERTDSYLDKLLDFELRNSDLSKLDKSFLTELVNGTIRWKVKIDYVISQFYRGDYSKLDINIKNAIRLAMYQIMLLERVPQSAAVNEAVEFIKKLRGQYLANLVNAILRTAIRKLNFVEYPSVEDDPVKALSVVHSFPTWLVRRFVNRFGVYETEQLLAALNDRPRLSIRVNTDRISVDRIASEFESRGLRVSRAQFIPNFLYVEGLSRIGELESFKAGHFTVQDESAGLVSKLLDPHPGERILDLCAAPGGKTTHILEMTNSNVDLTAVEKYENRARLIQNSLDRMGYSRAKVVIGDASIYTDAALFDKILVDAPCTGFGVIRKKPDSKWKREPEDIAKLNKIQSEILENAAKLLKPNGVIVYSTCTIESEENQDVVQGFLSHHSKFTLEPADMFVDRALVGRDGFIETFPHRHDLDGGFAARIRKNA
ncbi:MAG: 16S rRNA (cytosine(967)-C(5))-methyltransferase RsmB [Bacteroidetes bacterium]|nr:16S rRNA (cytosine(967)-C(5))-methyltransferase RsmB [Bacteroidota bacterium]MCL5738559.1 16S rRNA (cytosine(967)-C(5))-methyltransferase RsmB [Bacteroidota bacterium]